MSIRSISSPPSQSHHQRTKSTPFRPPRDDPSSSTTSGSATATARSSTAIIPDVTSLVPAVLARNAELLKRLHHTIRECAHLYRDAGVEIYSDSESGSGSGSGTPKDESPHHKQDVDEDEDEDEDDHDNDQDEHEQDDEDDDEDEQHDNNDETDESNTSSKPKRGLRSDAPRMTSSQFQSELNAIRSIYPSVSPTSPIPSVTNLPIPSASPTWLQAVAFIDGDETERRWHRMWKQKAPVATVTAAAPIHRIITSSASTSTTTNTSPLSTTSAHGDDVTDVESKPTPVTLDTIHLLDLNRRLMVIAEALVASLSSTESTMNTLRSQNSELQRQLQQQQKEHAAASRSQQQQITSQRNAIEQLMAMVKRMKQQQTTPVKAAPATATAPRPVRLPSTMATGIRIMPYSAPAKRVTKPATVPTPSSAGKIVSTAQRTAPAPASSSASAAATSAAGTSALTTTPLRRPAAATTATPVKTPTSAVATSTSTSPSISDPAAVSDVDADSDESMSLSDFLASPTNTNNHNNNNIKPKTQPKSTTATSVKTQVSNSIKPTAKATATTSATTSQSSSLSQSSSQSSTPPLSVPPSSSSSPSWSLSSLLSSLPATVTSSPSRSWSSSRSGSTVPTPAASVSELDFAELDVPNIPVRNKMKRDSITSIASTMSLESDEDPNGDAACLPPVGFTRHVINQDRFASVSDDEADVEELLQSTKSNDLIEDTTPVAAIQRWWNGSGTSTPSSGNTTSRKSLNEEYHEDGLMGITTGLAKSLVRVVAGAPVPVPEPEIR